MPPEPTTIWDLEDEWHRRNRRREWIAERCGVALMAGVVLVAVLGLLGPGRLSRQVKTSADGRLSVEHHTVQRHQAPARLLIDVAPSASGVIRLRLSRSFTDRVDVEQITPEPDAMEMTDNDLVYRFQTSDLTGYGTIVLRFQHDEYGSARCTVVVEGSEVQLSEFVLP
jgi:hypothetical protein